MCSIIGLVFLYLLSLHTSYKLSNCEAGFNLNQDMMGTPPDNIDLGASFDIMYLKGAKNSIYNW